MIKKQTDLAVNFGRFLHEIFGVWDFFVLEQTDMQDILRAIESSLSAKEAAVIIGSFGLCGLKNTQREMAEGLGCCPNRISQLKRKALRSLRVPSRAKAFSKYSISCLRADYERRGNLIDELKAEIEAFKKLQAERGFRIFPNATIDELELSVRAYNSLKKAGLKTIGEILLKSEKELAKLGFGRKTINEIKALLAKDNLNLWPDHG